ncbi:MAG TPA: response regulator transcription factor [Gaiellaceae bacterium]|jgi:two-component system response regulator RegX3
MSRILLVEDEPAIAEAVTYALRNAGYDVDHTENGTEALAAARDEHYDLMVLDLLLPGLPGLDVCRTLRAESDLPIVMLTASDTEDERVTGLDAGADDYVTKPFSVSELVSRVRALLRRRDLNRASSANLVRVGGLHLDIARHSATVDGTLLRLTMSEFRLIQLLASDPGEVFTRDELVKHLWESEFVGDRRAIDVHISNLRRKLEIDPRKPRRLLTVRGVGYKLVRV